MYDGVLFRWLRLQIQWVSRSRIPLWFNSQNQRQNDSIKKSFFLLSLRSRSSAQGAKVTLTILYRCIPTCPAATEPRCVFTSDRAGLDRACARTLFFTHNILLAALRSEEAICGNPNLPARSLSLLLDDEGLSLHGVCVQPVCPVRRERVTCSSYSSPCFPISPGLSTATCAVDD